MPAAGQECGALSSQVGGGVESSSDDHSSPAAGSQVSSCAVSRRTSIGPHLRSASEDAGHISTSESHENSIIRARQQCGAEILNFEHLKMQLDKLTGQNREKQRQSDAENGTSTISPSPSCACLSSQAAAANNLPCVGSWPLGLDRTPSLESDVLLPADSGVSSMRSVTSFATESVMALLRKCTGVEPKLLPSAPAWTASSAADVQGDSLASGLGGQHMRHEASVSSHHHHQRNPDHHQRRGSACPPLVNASGTLSAFQQPGYACDPSPACSTDWQQQQQLLLQQLQQQQQSLLMTQQQMHAQHPLLMQMLQYQQQLQQQQQAIQLMQSTLLPSQHKPPDLMSNAFVGPVPMATGLPLQYLDWQSQLTNLLIESGLLPAKAHELVQQLQHIMMPRCPVQFPPPSMLHSGCSIDAFYQLNNHLLSSQFCAGGLPAWSNVQAAYAKVVQLLAQPNSLVTPELLEAMFAQLPPPLNLNASSCLNPGVVSELLYMKLVEFLTMQIGQFPITPMQLTPPVSMHGFFGTSTTPTSVDSPACMSKSAAVQSKLPHLEDKPGALSMGSMQVGTPTKLTRRTSSSGLDGSNTVGVTQSCPLHRGTSVESESGDIPGLKVSGVPRSGIACSRHHSLPTGNGAKVAATSMTKKNVDCPQGLADLDMALKEKLRPRTTKGIGQTVPEHSKTGAVVAVSNAMVSSVPSASHQSAAAAAAACDLERTCVTCVCASNGNTVTASRNTSAATLDASTALKGHSVSIAKCTGVGSDEKAETVRKQEVPTAQEIVCKASDVATGTVASSRLKTVSHVLGNAQLPEVSKDVIIKPSNSNMCVSVAASSVQLAVAAKSSAQFRECASDHCLPAASVPVSYLSLLNSDINRQHVSDSAIASVTTHLAQKHLQKKAAVTDQETISATDVTTRQPHPVTAVSSRVFWGFFLAISVGSVD